jgi:hypothetical protein
VPTSILKQITVCKKKQITTPLEKRNETIINVTTTNIENNSSDQSGMILIDKLEKYWCNKHKQGK